MAGGGPAMARACVLLLLVSAYCAWAFVPPPPRRLAAPAVQVRSHGFARAFIGDGAVLLALMLC